MRREATALGLAAATAIAACADPLPGAAQLLAIDPAWGLTTLGTPVEIRGKGFTLKIQVSYADSSQSNIDSRFSAWLADTPLLDVTFVDAETITAIAPDGMPIGMADLKVTDPNDRTILLVGAFTVHGLVGICVDTQIAEGTPCDDQDACTEDDVCAGGSCSGSLLDADGDGTVAAACGGADCADDDPSIPTTEICNNGVDDDCDPTTPDIATCGNGQTECNESCDDGDTDDCTAGCNATCTGPATANICGDDLARCGEACDGSDLPDCTSLGFALPGVTACTGGCVVDSTGCTCDPALDLDTDGDGLCDLLDSDDDNDSCPDNVDIDPLNPPSQAYPSLSVFFIGQDMNRIDGQADLDLSTGDQAAVQLIESSGHTVTFFEPTTGGCNAAHDNQAVYDAALAAGTFDVIFLSESCQTNYVVDGDSADPTAPTYLNDAQIGLLANDDAIMDNLFFGDTVGTDIATRIDLVDNGHFTTSFLPAIGPVDLLDVDRSMAWVSANGNLAPDLVSLAAMPSDAQKKSMLFVESGGALLYATVAAERRLGLPAFNPGDWNLFGQTLFLRALLWSAGADQSPPMLDADVVPAHCDNCPDVYNPAQTDTDGDGLGDACDP